MTVRQFDRTGVIFREDTTPSYWEIGTYLPPVIPQAPLIPIGRISRERRPRGWRYTVHTHAGAYTAFSRASAINNAHALAIKHPSYNWE